MLRYKFTLSHILVLLLIPLIFQQCGHKPSAETSTSQPTTVVAADTVASETPLSIVATTAADTLTASELSIWLNGYPTNSPADMIEEWAEASTVDARAAESGLLQNVHILRRLRLARLAVLKSALMQESGNKTKEPSKKEIRRYFDRHFHEFRVGRPMARGLLIYHTDPDTAEMARELFCAGATSDQIQHRLHGVMSQNTGYVYRNEILPAYASFLFDSTSTCSGVIPIPPYHVVVKRTGKRERDHHFTLGEVEEQIRLKLIRKQISELDSEWEAGFLAGIGLHVDSLALRSLLEQRLQNPGLK